MDSDTLGKILSIRREQADEYSRAHNLNLWGFRIAWWALTEGPVFTRRVCSKYNRQSPAWLCYHRLVALGILVEGPEGGLITDHRDPDSAWAGDDGAMAWLEAIARAACGEPIHPDLPRCFVLGEAHVP